MVFGNGFNMTHAQAKLERDATRVVQVGEKVKRKSAIIMSITIFQVVSHRGRIDVL